jgi:hypothetical protein
MIAFWWGKVKLDISVAFCAGINAFVAHAEGTVISFSNKEHTG